MAESRFTSAGVYVEIDGQLVRVTNAGAYVEVSAVLQRQTAAGLYVEIVRAQARATSAGLYLEIGEPCSPTIEYFFGEQNISEYCSSIKIEIVREELPGGRQLGSGSLQIRPGRYSATAELSGEWSPEIDSLLGVQALRQEKVSGRVQIEDCIKSVRYSWESAVRVISWKISTRANGKIEWSAVLRHIGVCERDVRLS